MSINRASSPRFTLQLGVDAAARLELPCLDVVLFGGGELAVPEQWRGLARHGLRAVGLAAVASA